MLLINAINPHALIILIILTLFNNTNNPKNPATSYHLIPETIPGLDPGRPQRASHQYV